MTPPRHCDYDRYLCTLFVKKDVRCALWVAIELGHDIMRIPANTSEEMVGLVRLKWWQEELSRLSDESYVPPTPLLQQFSSKAKGRLALYSAAGALCDTVAEYGFMKPLEVTHLTVIMRSYFTLLCATATEEDYASDYDWLAEIIARLAHNRTYPHKK